MENINEDEVTEEEINNKKLYEDSDEYYLEMTFHGSETLESYKKSHVVTLKKKTKAIKKTILEL